MLLFLINCLKLFPVDNLCVFIYRSRDYIILYYLLREHLDVKSTRQYCQKFHSIYFYNDIKLYLVCINSGIAFMIVRILHYIIYLQVITILPPKRTFLYKLIFTDETLIVVTLNLCFCNQFVHRPSSCFRFRSTFDPLTPRLPQALIVNIFTI